MDEMVYNPDGTIQNRPYWSVEGPAQVESLNPFKRVEAETMAWSEGVKTRFETEWEGDFDWARGKRIADRLFVTAINHGDYIKVQGVDFSDGADSIEVSVSPIYGGQIEIRADQIDGPLIATVDINAKRQEGIWSSFTGPANNIKGVHDVYFVFKGEKDLFYFDWWQFHAETSSENND